MGYQEERRAAGDKTLAAMFGGAPAPRSTPLLNAKRDFVAGEVWTRPGLTLRERWLITLTCVGHQSSPTANDRYVHGALQSKALSLQEMREFVLQFAGYCGWSKAELLDDAVTRAAEALGLEEPPEPQRLSVEPAERRARSAASWVSVMTFPDPAPTDTFVSAFALDFLFGEIWDRPGLDRRARRFVTMASVGMNGAYTPIVSHVYASLNSGQVRREEMEEFILQFAVYAGSPRTSKVHRVTLYVAACLAEGRAPDGIPQG